MDPCDLTPPMFRMEPPFPNMQIGKIRISHPGGETVGELIPYHFPHDHIFGARIEIFGAAVYNSRAVPIPTGQFAAAGHFIVTILGLSQNLLRKIQQLNDSDFPYALKIP